MLAAIDFNHKRRFDAGEISDEWADEMLSAKLETTELAVPQQRL